MATNWDDVAFEFCCAQPGSGDDLYQWPLASVYLDFLKRYPEHAWDLQETMRVMVWWAWCEDNLPKHEPTPEEIERDRRASEAMVARVLRKMGIKPTVAEDRP